MESLVFSLKYVGSVDRKTDIGPYDLERDSVVSVLSDVCASLADAEAGDFVVSGFGEERWPVDVRTDLPTVLEQLPGLFDFLRGKDDEFTLEFFEQGVERQLTFRAVEDEVVVRCASQTSWSPQPESVIVTKRRLSEICQAFRDEVIDVLTSICPVLSEEPLFAEWQQSLESSTAEVCP